MRWRLLAFVPPAVLMTALLFLAVSSFVSALESSLERDPIPIAEIERGESESRPLLGHAQFLEAEIFEEDVSERATFVF